MKKRIYMFSEGNKEMKSLLGGKGANLCQMSVLGLPVPKGFIVTTESCKEFLKNQNEISKELIDEIKLGVKKLQIVTGKEFGGKNPLLVSVRSGAPVSMPGMMDTILNLGLNDKVVQNIGEKFSDLKFAYEIYLKFIEMFSEITEEIPREKFLELKEKAEKEKGNKGNCEFFKDLIKKYKALYLNVKGKNFPEDPQEQLEIAVVSIFNSWNNNRAKVYRELNGISEEMGTAVNIQEMVFGNLNDRSATGVAFTRNPATGENAIFGEYLIGAQGEDIVAGIRTPDPMEMMKKTFPKQYKEFARYAKYVEKYYKDMQDMEFTIENDKLYILQTRNGKRSGVASVRIAVEMVEEKLITKEEAILKINSRELNALLNGGFNKLELEKFKLIGKGLAGSAGVATGKVILLSEKVKDSDTILVRNETSPEDLRGMSIARGILTAKGGLTSHGAVVARGMGKCCVAGCSELIIDMKNNQFLLGETIVKEGDHISIDGYTGNIYLGEIPIIMGEIGQEFKKLLSWCKEIKKMSVRMNADTPEDCDVGLKFGAEGVGLCRTEHMFFKDERIWSMREMILSKTLEERKKALAKIEPYQREDFKAMFKILGDKPLNIRLLDPPLHEFLPKSENDMKKMAEIMKLSLEEIEFRNSSLEEHNPMLGHRGCRLAITYPEIYVMQVKALVEAAIEVKQEGGIPNFEIMIPLVLSREELKVVKKLIEEEIVTILKEKKEKLEYKIGTMIELPRACVAAGEIAHEAEFFSFGTNDLTQTTLGISRDDSAKFIEEYK
ncbi:MAG: pyruvate, phosphate dikinase, partial [Fusobacteriaceae bacterium]